MERGMRLRRLTLSLLSLGLVLVLQSGDAFAGTFRMRMENGVTSGTMSTNPGFDSFRLVATSTAVVNPQSFPTPRYSPSTQITTGASAGQVHPRNTTVRNALMAPEPGALMLFGAGLLGVVRVMRSARRRNGPPLARA
jgi:hypothetical protein